METEFNFKRATGEMVSASEAPDGELIQVPFSIQQGAQNGLCITIPDIEGCFLVDVYMEIENGQLILYVWDEHDIGQDPTARIVLLEDARDRVWRGYE